MAAGNSSKVRNRSISSFRRWGRLGSKPPTRSAMPVQATNSIGQPWARALSAPGQPEDFGTDGGVYPHGDNARQFPIMVEYGMKPLDAIRAATISAAELLGRGGEIGVVAKDAFADVIAVQGDPRADVKLLENVRFVMKGGVVYKDK